LAIYREKDIFERRNAANEAKKALLERFKTKPAADDPAVLARQVERKAILEARAIREKAVVTASVSCGRSSYVEPILPPVTSMARAAAFTIRPSADPIAFPLPRIAPGIAASAEATRTLSCR